MLPTTPLPIAVVMTSFDPGGTERQMTELVRRLDRSRWAVHLACFRRSGAWFERVAQAAVSVAEFPVDSFRRPSLVRHSVAFARWCRQRRIAVVHTATLPANIFGLPAAALAGVPVRIANRREVNPDKTPIQIGLQRLAYGFAHKVVANSQAAARRLRVERVPDNKIEVIPNGLDSSAFGPRPQRSKLRHVIVVANLRDEKRHDDLIDAAPLVLRWFPDAKFHIIGDGPERARLVARAASRGVSDACVFYGHQEDIPRLLADADIFVLPSRSEAFPNAVLEAMGAGLPVVASAIDGIRGLVEPGRTGLLVPVSDVSALADSVCRLMDNAELGTELGDRARLDVQTRYSFDRMVAAFESLYVTELSRRAALAASRSQPVTS